jgi:ADP-ribosylglycohydrolase
MVDAQLYSRVYGCMLGSAIGDSFGAVVEFRSAEEVQRIAGSHWVDRFLPFSEVFPALHPLGTWEACPPRGTGTDDTRNNHVFAECVIRNNGRINSQLLAMEYVERYRDRERFYPKHPDLAEQHYRSAHELACAHLGMRETPGGMPGWAVNARGNDFPMLLGLISLAFAGLLHRDDPEAAYVSAFELDFTDVGYAKDATAMMAAMVSTALGGEVTAREIIDTGLHVDPFGYGEERIMARRLRQLIEVADQATDDRGLVTALAREVATLHPYDPIDVLGVPVAAAWFADGDPLRTIVMAANDRDVDEEGNLVSLRDVDCTGGVAGAIVGALNGAEAFPQDWVADTLRANRELYGIDIESNARRFCEAVYGE